MTDIQVNPIAGALGAEVLNIDLSKQLSNEEMDTVHQAFLDHQVIFFRDQDMSPEQHIDFARHFGELDYHRFVPGLPDYPEIMPIIKAADDEGNTFGGIWHTDVSFQEKPALGSVLYGKQLPEYGGDTVFSNMYMAYETLSDSLKEILDGMRAIHSADRAYGLQKPKDSEQRFAVGDEDMNVRFGEDAAEEVSHPLVRTHPETGRKCLYINHLYTMRFDGWTTDESQGLLKFLCDWSVKPDFTCRFRWYDGSVAFWDNRCVQHYALDDYRGHRREMHRVTICGDRPV